MKKSILAIILMLPYYAYADSVTTGDIGLILPTTGAIDTRRNGLDKINKNFQTLVTTLTDVRTLVSTSASALNSFFTNSSGTAFVLTDGSTQTKNGGMNFGGAVSVGSSFTVSGVTVAIGGQVYQFQSTAPASNSILHYDGDIGSVRRVIWGADASGGAAAAATGTESSTFTVCLCSGGDVFSATSPYRVEGVGYEQITTTFNITAARAFTAFTSSLTVTFGVGRSTEIGDSNINFSGIHTSSFVSKENLKYGNRVLPNTYTRILPEQRLGLFVINAVSSGTAPSGKWGVILEGWKEAGK